MSVSALAIITLLCISGCGGGGSKSEGGGSKTISVSVTSSATTINGGGTVTVTATVANDSSNAEVSWTAPTIGSLSSLTALAPTYTAPAATNAAQSVTLTATLVADTSKSATVTLTINPKISVSVSAPATTVDGNDAVTVTATVANDSSNAGVTWTAPSLGSLSSLTASAPTFTAPAATASAQTVTLTATSVADKTQSNSVTVTIPAAPAITTTSLPTAIAGAAYSATLAGSGGIAPYTWKLTSGTLPTGMSLNATNGVLSAAAGATTAKPATSLTFVMTDSGLPTALTATATLSLTINAISVSVTAPVTAVDGNDTVTVTATVTNDSSNAGVTWTAPAIGSLSSLTALAPIYTAPAATASAQSVTLTATSVADKTKSNSVTLIIPVAPTIITSSLPSFVAGTAYSIVLAGSGGIGPYTWTLTSGTLPVGMSLNATTGVLSAAAGATTTTPATNLTFKMTDSGSPTALTASATLSLTINPPPSAPIAGSVIYSNSCGPQAGPATTVSINTTPVQSTTTDSNGNFTFLNVPYGTYKVTPSLAGTNAIFTPATQIVTVGSGGAVASFNAVVGYAVSGNVSYTGNATGPINLILQYQCSGGSSGYTLGTSILAPGPFTINGAAPGSYTVHAWRDNLGYGSLNASNPTALTDPAPVTFSTAPDPPAPFPMDQGVFFFGGVLDNYSSTYAANIELASSYTVQWSANSSFSPIAGSKNYPATGSMGTGQWVLNGLSNGSIYYFREQAVAGSTTSQWSLHSGPVTIGAPTGSVTASGDITFAQPATGPLYIFFNDPATYGYYFMKIANPVSPQHYSIQLPKDDNYSIYAFIDQNNDDVFDDGDMLPAVSDEMIAITGSTATKDITLNGGGNRYIGWQTYNNQSVGSSSGTTQQYVLSFLAWNGSKQLVAAELVSGPNVVIPQDISYCDGTSFYFAFCSSINLYGNTPKVGDAYGLQLTYSDGSQETVSETVASVPGSFGTNPSSAGVGTSLTPNFTWTDPPNASNYGYTFDLTGGSENWSIPGGGWGTFPSSIQSLSWGVDPTGAGNLPSQASLTSGVSYNWDVSAYDSNDNVSILEVGYYPGYTRVYLPAANPATLGAATVGQSYSGTIVATNGTAPYTFTVTGLCDGLTSSSSGGTLTISGTPIAAGTVSFQVYVIDNTNYSWGPVTYTITVGP